MSHETFRAELVSRNGAHVDVKVPRGCYVTDLERGFDRTWDWRPSFRCGIGDLVLLMGPDAWKDHAGAVVEGIGVATVYIRIKYGSLGQLKWIVKAMAAKRAKRTKRVA